MANVCHNQVIITGPPDDLSQLRSTVASPDSVFDFAYIEIDTADAGEWRERWGEPAFCVDAELVDGLHDERPTRLAYSYDTAWSPAVEVLRRLSERFPRAYLDMHGMIVEGQSIKAAECHFTAGRCIFATGMGNSFVDVEYILGAPARQLDLLALVVWVVAGDRDEIAAATEALATKDRRIVLEIGRTLAAHTSPDVRYGALRVIDRCSDRSVIDVLLRGLLEEEFAIRSEALDALCYVADFRALLPMYAMFRDFCHFDLPVDHIARQTPIHDACALATSEEPGFRFAAALVLQAQPVVGPHEDVLALLAQDSEEVVRLAASGEIYERPGAVAEAVLEGRIANRYLADDGRWIDLPLSPPEYDEEALVRALSLAVESTRRVAGSDDLF